MYRLGEESTLCAKAWVEADKVGVVGVVGAAGGGGAAAATDCG